MLQAQCLKPKQRQEELPSRRPPHYDILLQAGAANQRQDCRFYKLTPPSFPPSLPLYVLVFQIKNGCFFFILKKYIFFYDFHVVLHTACLCLSLPPPSVLVCVLCFYCTRWLYIIGAALPFHFHKTNSQLCSSKLGSGGEEGGGEGLGYSFKRN